MLKKFMGKQTDTSKGQEKKHHKTLLYSAAAGAIGTVVWKKKDLLKAVVLLGSKSRGWVQIGAEPETYLTKNTQEAQDEFFAYLGQDAWRLVDQVADGYFWLSASEEVILLQQKRVLREKYCLWVASKSFGLSAETEKEKA